MHKPAIRIALTAAAAISLGAAAPGFAHKDGEAALAEVLQDRVAGAPQSCIPYFHLGSSQVIDGLAIVYRGGGSQLYVNRPRGSTRELDGDVILVTRSVSSSLCRGDVVDLVDRNTHTPVGFVTLGDFISYEHVRKAKARRRP